MRRLGAHDERPRLARHGALDELDALRDERVLVGLVGPCLRHAGDEEVAVAGPGDPQGARQLAAVLLDPDEPQLRLVLAEPVLLEAVGALHVPFAEVTGAIPGACQRARPERHAGAQVGLRGGHGVRHVRHPVAVGQVAGEEARARGRADGVRGVAALEARALRGQALEVGREARAAGRHRVGALLVRDDEEEVGAGAPHRTAPRLSAARTRGWLRWRSQSAWAANASENATMPT